MKKFFILLFCLIILFFCLPIGIIYFYNPIKPINSLKKADYAVVFGAAIRKNTELSPILKERVDDAIQLYKKKKVRKLVFSGAFNHQIYPGEPMAMRLYAQKRGVKNQDIILDERGDSTYLTIQYVKYLRQRKAQITIIYVSSYYHIPRIHILSHMLGVNEYQTYFSKKNFDINKSVLRETVAFWSYIVFYPFYKLDGKLSTNT